MRAFLDAIFEFINAESLTDDEFESIDLDTQEYSKETYLALRTILEGREEVSNQVKRLKLYFIAKGVDLNTTPGIPTPKSNIYIGDAL